MRIYLTIGMLACTLAACDSANQPLATSTAPDGTTISDEPVKATTGAGEYLVIDLSLGPQASEYSFDHLSRPPPVEWADEYRTTKLLLRRIAAGSFTMGSPIDEVKRQPGETQHEVTLTRDFYIGVFEVTQEQWHRVMGDWPSSYSNEAHRAARPVESVSYDDIRGASLGAGWPRSADVDEESFLGRLRQRTGLPELDLPTEAQWEYACRAGTTTPLNSGKHPNTRWGQDDPNMKEVGRCFFNGGSGYPFNLNRDTRGGTARVGSYLPNAWGLYDMHGNVGEWCLDWAGEYPSGATIDPSGPSSGQPRERPFGSPRVVRGGGWYTIERFSSANRGGFDHGLRGPEFGFRIVRTLP